MKKALIIIFATAIIGLIVYEVNRDFSDKKGVTDEYSADNVVLAIRGFRHDQLLVSGGNTGHYEVGVGEEFKVLGIVHILKEDVLLSWQGPAGIGNGNEVLKAPGEEVTKLQVFTATAPGTAEFILTSTGENSKVIENKIIVEIK